MQIINEVTKSASLIAELKDSSKLRLRGVLQLSEVGELGRVSAQPLMPVRPAFCVS